MSNTTESTRDCIARHWAAANAGDWAAFAALLDDTMRYEVPQTREYIDGSPGYLAMFRTWPGPWRADVQALLADGERAVTVIDFVTVDGVETGISLFRVREGRIVEVIDHWPEAYEPPPRATPHLKRHPQ